MAFFAVLPWAVGVFWGSVLLLAGMSLIASVVTAFTPRRWLVLVAALTLVGAVVLVALPHSRPSPVAAIAVALLAIAVSVTGGGQAVLAVLAMAARDGVREGAHGGILLTDQTGDAGARPSEVLRGGTAIGLFERGAAAAAILAGMPEALAVIVAIKGIGRFTELDAPEARERFIIGTLVSLSWAGACGALAYLALR